MAVFEICNQLHRENGDLYCGIGRFEDGRSRPINLEVCESCMYGELYREIKCVDLAGEVGFKLMSSSMTTFNDVVISIPCSYRCKRTLKRTDEDTCRSCRNREEAEVRLVLTEGTTLLKAKGLDKALIYISDAEAALNNPNRKPTDTENVLTHSAAALEETLKRILCAYGDVLVGTETLADLWRVLRPHINIEGHFYKVMDGMVRGSMNRFIELRNQQSRNHAPLRTPSEVEARFYRNVVVILIDFLVRIAITDGKL